MTLIGKRALITGAARGIGRGCALAMAHAGADIVLNDRQASPDLAETAASIRAIGRSCHVLEADIFCRDSREWLIEQAVAVSGDIDILVNCPALNIRRPFLELDIEEFEAVVAGTLVAAFHLCQITARHMVAEGILGRLLHISSVHAEMPIAGNVAYGASKAALNHMVQTAAVELAPYRINVNAVAPGWTDTPGERKLTDPAELERRAQLLPWSRLGTAKDVANLVLFLASDAADYITGTIVTVDGAYRYKHCATEA